MHQAAGFQQLHWVLQPPLLATAGSALQAEATHGCMS
jgi:hypothetical protein